jgi:hypothetical protein
MVALAAVGVMGIPVRRAIEHTTGGIAADRAKTGLLSFELPSALSGDFFGLFHTAI